MCPSYLQRHSNNLGYLFLGFNATTFCTIRIYEVLSSAHTDCGDLHSDADVRYGITYWYTNTEGGGKLREMQYAWAFFNTMCAMFGVWVYLLWNEAVVGVHRDRRIFRQKVNALEHHTRGSNWMFVVVGKCCRDTTLLTGHFAAVCLDGYRSTGFLKNKFYNRRLLSFP